MVKKTKYIPFSTSKKLAVDQKKISFPKVITPLQLVAYIEEKQFRADHFGEHYCYKDLLTYIKKALRDLMKAYSE